MSAEKVYSIVSQIPKGYVLTYGDVAKLSGIRNPRVVGNILHKNDDPKTVPCHRVVRADGGLAPGYAFGGRFVQEGKLRSEGVRFIGGKVDLSYSRWQFDSARK